VDKLIQPADKCRYSLRIGVSFLIGEPTRLVFILLLVVDESWLPIVVEVSEEQTESVSFETALLAELM
jgi:hypothetical protein